MKVNLLAGFLLALGLVVALQAPAEARDQHRHYYMAESTYTESAPYEEAYSYGRDPSPTPRPLPINGVTVDLGRGNPYRGRFRGGTHVERPPFMFHEREQRQDGGRYYDANRQSLQQGRPRRHGGRGGRYPQPNPTPPTR